MNFSPEQVELIVQRVVAQLGPGAVAAPAAASERPVAPSPVLPVQIADQIVTQALLAEAVNGSNQVRIGPKAILTPSARDFVKQRGIQIIREASAAKPSSQRWQIIVSRTNPNITAAVEGLSQLGVTASVTLSGLPAEAAALATSFLCRGDAAKVVVFTDQPELVACLVNRNDKVRAAATANAASVERVLVSMQPNLIAVNPDTRSAHEIKSLLKVFKPS